jgi:hypothetical protein
MSCSSFAFGVASADGKKLTAKAPGGSKTFDPAPGKEVK